MLPALSTRDQVHEARVRTRGWCHELVFLPCGAAVEVGPLPQPDAGHARVVLALPAAGEALPVHRVIV